MNPDNRSNRRRHPRILVHGVTGGFAAATDASVVNMSLAGLAVETSLYPRVGEPRKLRISNGRTALSLEIHIVWSRLTRTVRSSRGEVTPIYRAGAEFPTPSGRSRKLLEAFIEQCRVASTGAPTNA